MRECHASCRWTLFLSAGAFAVAGCDGNSDAVDGRLAQIPEPVCLDGQGIGASVSDYAAESSAATPSSEREAIRDYLAARPELRRRRYAPLKRTGEASYFGHRTASGRITVVLSLSRQSASWRVIRAVYCY